MSYLPNEPAWKRRYQQDPSFDPDKKVKVEKKVKPVQSNKLSEKEVFTLIKSEQVDLLLKLGFEGIVPRLEKDRVELILKLQK